jgi:DNA-binding NtrC family response regulator
MTGKPIGNGERILVVDDDEFVCNSLKWLLMDDGYNVETAPDGTSAVEMLSKQTFDLVLTDLMMPEVDGLAVLQEVKRISPNTAVIILTGYGTLEAAMAALQQGAYDFLTKPCDDGEMKYKIQGALEQKRLKERVSDLEGGSDRLAKAREMLEHFAAHFDRETARIESMTPEQRKAAFESLRRKLDEARKAMGPAGASEA